MAEEYGQLAVESRAQWRRWLAEHGGTVRGVWVVTWKKGSGQPYVSYDEVVAEAIAAGWVDSRSRRVDDLRSSLLVTPRRATSRWSASNRARVAELEAGGLMQPAGRAAVEAARAAGTWDPPGEAGAAAR